MNLFQTHHRMWDSDLQPAPEFCIAPEVCASWDTERVLTEVPTISDVNHLESKKARLDSLTSNSLPESCVLHVRGLPPDTTEHEVSTLAIPFGSIANMIVTKKTCQALIEMDTLESAESMFSYYTTVCPPKLRGRYPVEIQFSKYSSLTNSNNNNNNAVVSAIQEANKQFAAFRIENEESAKTVLHIHVERLLPSSEIGYLPFFLAFRPFGRILRVVSFRKNESRHAFLEFSNSISAHVAKLQMNGVPLFPAEGNFCILRTEFSRQPTLEVHREDSSSRDFTRNPWNEIDESQEIASIMSGNKKFQPILSSVQPDLNDLSEEKLSNMDPASLTSLANRLIKPLLRVAASVSGPQADVLRAQASALGGLSALISENQSHCESFSWPIIPNVSTQEVTQNASRIYVGSPVVFVSNLNEEKVNPDTLFILFGVYGDVQRVKIIHNKRSTALVQMTDASQALRAVNFLNGVPLYGKTLRCILSKNTYINMPQNILYTPDGDESQNTCDYSGHKLHRFKHVNSRNHFNICAPSKVLHVTNLPDVVDEEKLKNVFEHICECRVSRVKTFKAEKKMALVELETLEEAISALITMHDYPIEEKMRLRVSFSKSAI